MKLLESYIDVLIIGAGPAGIMCANALAMAGINVRIIDKRPIGIAAGQADGIAPRTIEVLQSYGLAERVLREGNQIHLYTFYDPGPDGKLRCTNRIPFVTDPDVPYPFLIGLKQAAIEANFVDSLKDHGVQIERPKQPSCLEISEDPDELSNPRSYPVKVTVEHLDESSNSDDCRTEIIHAKYVVGADGAHSWMRKTLGIRMEGEQTDHVWGVLDVKTKSDFPDIRNNAAIHSPKGNCLNIPREDGMSRLYIQLTDGVLQSSLSEKIDKNNMTPEILLSVAEKILDPYKIGNPEDVVWWSLYIIGQRIASSYSASERVFIVGDACHTHSPKGGQGMNAGINDSHNLAWKLAHVLRGWSSQSLLKTYEFERRKFAQDLINSDKEYATLISRKPKTTEREDGVTSEQYSGALEKRHGLFSGFGIQYLASAVVNSKHQASAGGLTIGRRMLPYIFIRAADVRPVEIHNLLPSDGRFKVLFFSGSVTSTRVLELESLAERLRKPSSFLQKYGAGNKTASAFDIITIIAADKRSTDYILLPAFFRPHWTKVLVDDTDLRNIHGGHGYEKFGIDVSGITIVVVRPDGYVGMIAPSTEIGDLDEYFHSFTVPCEA